MGDRKHGPIIRFNFLLALAATFASVFFRTQQLRQWFWGAGVSDSSEPARTPAGNGAAPPRVSTVFVVTTLARGGTSYFVRRGYEPVLGGLWNETKRSTVHSYPRFRAYPGQCWIIAQSREPLSSEAPASLRFHPYEYELIWLHAGSTTSQIGCSQGAVGHGCYG